jgi:hypothetical protein
VLNCTETPAAPGAANCTSLQTTGLGGYTCDGDVPSEGESAKPAQGPLSGEDVHYISVKIGAGAEKFFCVERNSGKWSTDLTSVPAGTATVKFDGVTVATAP